LRAFHGKAKLSHSTFLERATIGSAICASGVMVGATYVGASLFVTIVFEKEISASFNH
jgi:hypothetical protein